MVILEWEGGRGFTVSDHVVAAKCHRRDGVLKLYVETVTGKEYWIRDPSDTSNFKFKEEWEYEGRKKLDVLKKILQEKRSDIKTSETETIGPKKTIERKAK